MTTIIAFLCHRGWINLPAQVNLATRCLRINVDVVKAKMFPDGTPVEENATFGLRAAAPALACNDSYFDEKVISWDPDLMEVL